MARKARAVVAGVPHHVTQRSSRGQDIFSSEGDRELYLDLLFRQARRHLVHVWGYCLMRDHVHFLVEPFLSNSLARAFGCAHADYARYQNLRQQRVERFWKGRFASCAVAEDQALAVLAYIENNPVRASLAPAAEDYPWSSARAHCLDADAIRLVPESVLGLRMLKRGFVPPYTNGKAFLIPEATPASATSVFERLKARSGETKPVQIADEVFEATDRYLGKLCVFRKGRYLAGFANLKPEDDAAARAKSLAARIP